VDTSETVILKGRGTYLMASSKFTPRWPPLPRQRNVGQKRL